MRRISLGLLIAAAGIGASLRIPHSASAQEPDLVEQIRAAWRARQEKVKSFDAKWQMLIPTPKGHHGTDAHGAPIPPEDLTLAIDFRLVSDGKKIKYTRSGVDWDADKYQFAYMELVRTSDGFRRSDTWHRENAVNGRRFAFVKDGEAFDDGGEWRLAPILFAFRPLDPSMGLPQLGEFQSTGRRENVSGVSCHVLEQSRRANLTELLYVAADSDFRPLRRAAVVDGVVTHELAIEYVTHPDWGRLPSSFTEIRRNKLGTAFPMRIVPKIELSVNAPVDRDDVEYSYPPGTVLYHTATSRYAIVRNDGTLRPFSMGELTGGTTYDDLMTRDPPPEALPFPGQERWWYGWIVAGVLVLAVVVWLRYRYRRT